jgi:hypothetical protein
LTKKSFTDSSNINRIQSSIEIKQTILLNHYPELLKYYGQMSPNEIKLLYKKFGNIILWIDIFSFIADLTVVTWLYFNHFNYNKNGYKTIKKDNIIRIICLILSFGVVVALIIRYRVYLQYQNVKYMLSLKASIPIQKISFIKLSLESISHIIQPYPFLSCNFKINSLGVDVTYSLDMILFTLSIFRLYVIFKLIKVYNTYTNSRGQKINSFFGNKNHWMFLYRTNLKANGFKTLFLIFLIIILVGSYTFKIFENYQTDEESSDFGNFFNCLWFIAQSNANLGFGDYVPVTLVGRIIAGIVCMSGVFLKSLFTVSTLMFILIVDENEKKAFAEINLLYKKEQLNNGYNIYFNHYIKTKFTKILEDSRKKNLMELIDMKITLKIIKEKYFLRLLASMKIPLTLTEFCNFVKTQWEPQAEDTIEWYRERIDTFHQFNDFLCDHIQSYQSEVLNCYVGNTKMVNLVSFIFLCGNLFPVQSENDIKGDNLVSIKTFENKLKEFHLLYFDKKLVVNKKNKYQINERKRRSIFPAVLEKKYDSDEDEKNAGNSYINEDIISYNDELISEYEDFSSYIYGSESGSFYNKSNYSD